MLQKLRNRKGFTLVELMIVVAIIGILAAIAIPNFLQFRLKAKTSEAKSNLGAIRSTEVAYFAEWNYWVAGQSATPVGNRAGRTTKVAWVTTTNFSILGFAPEGAVFYDYQLQPTGAANKYVVQSTGMSIEAIGDLDGDSVLSSFTVNDSSNEIDHSGGTF
jgi:type IV pilus assembly protein PilA